MKEMAKTRDINIRVRSANRVNIQVNKTCMNQCIHVYVHIFKLRVMYMYMYMYMHRQPDSCFFSTPFKVRSKIIS